MNSEKKTYFTPTVSILEMPSDLITTSEWDLDEIPW